MTTNTDNKTHNQSTTDWDKHNNRPPSEIKTDILSRCFDLRIHPISTSQILFAAGFTASALTVTRFFEGRERWLKNKAVENTPKSEAG